MSDFPLVQIQEDPRRCQQVIDYLYSDFYPRERCSQSAGLHSGTYFNLVDDIIGFLKQGCSFAIIEPQSDGVIGIAVNCIVTRTDSYDLSSFPQAGQRAIVSFLEELNKAYDVFDTRGRAAKAGLEIYYLGVKEEFGGRGLARRMAEATIAVARERGLEFVNSFPSSPATIHLFERLGFETKSEMKMANFTINGLPAFPCARPDDRTRYVIKFL